MKAPILLLCVVLCGCADTQKVILDSTLRAPTTSVEVYKDGHSPDRKFKEIAELSWRGPRTDELKAQRYFMKQAEKLGGDGIVFTVVSGDTKVDWGVGGANGVVMGGGNVSTDWLFKAKVIVSQ